MLKTKHFHIPTGYIGFFGCLLISLNPGFPAEDPPEGKPQLSIGQQWEYLHTGPRPGSMKPIPIDGRRTRRVIEQIEENQKNYWIIEEHFSSDPCIIAHLLIDEENHLKTMKIYHVTKGEFMRMTYNPTLPYPAPQLAVGEEKTYECQLTFGLGELTLPDTVVFKRLPDESVDTPAGQFPDAQRYHISTTCIFDVKIAKIPFREERTIWYHPKANGVIKEIFKKDDMKFLTFKQEGYTATGVLASYTAHDSDDAIAVSKEIVKTQQKGMSLGTKLLLAQIATVVVCLLILAALLLLARYLWRKIKRKKEQGANDPLEPLNRQHPPGSNETESHVTNQSVGKE